MFDHQHRPGLDAVDDHGGHQDRRGSRSGNSERKCRNDMAGDGGHVAGFRGHQAVDRSLAELLSLLAHGLGRGIGHQAPASSPTPGIRPVRTPMTPDRSTVRQYCATSRNRGSTESRISTIFRSTGSASVVSTSPKPNAPTSAGISEMPPESWLHPNVKRSWA